MVATIIKSVILGLTLGAGLALVTESGPIGGIELGRRTVFLDRNGSSACRATLNAARQQAGARCAMR